MSAAGSARDIVVYDCRPGRAGQYACEMLSGWSGTLVADGYAGYRALFRDGQEGPLRRHRVSVRRGAWRTCAESSWSCTE